VGRDEKLTIKFIWPNHFELVISHDNMKITVISFEQVIDQCPPFILSWASLQQNSQAHSCHHAAHQYYYTIVRLLTNLAFYHLSLGGNQLFLLAQ